MNTCLDKEIRLFSHRNFIKVHYFFGIDFHIDLFIHVLSKNNDFGIRVGIFWNLLAYFSLLFRHIFLHRLLDALFPDFWLPLGYLGRLLGFLIENGRQNGTRFAPGDHLFRSWGQPGLLQKRIRSRTLILDGFLMDLGWNFHGFRMDLG